jgi:hypothetical protein
MTRFILVVVVVLVGCNREARQNPPAPSDPASLPAPTPAPTPTPTPTVDDPCAEIRTRFNAELAKKTDACNTDADCACHGAEGGGCGGVTDKATATRLAPISKEFHDKGCRYLVQCAAWACAPKCQNGRCSQ